ncbi:hypothetical protein J0H58_34305, partial [bacterium]|nr:hypothetical protein [bacterium]
MLPIEAVTVCTGYGDILAEVAPYNRPLLDRWVVVTTADDEQTRAVCRACSIETVTVNREEVTREGEFSKGRLIERGLAMIGGHAWTLHLDGDVALPADLHQVLDDAHLDESAIHGCDRLNVVGAASWDRLRSGGLWCRSTPWAVHLKRPETTVGTRVANPGFGYTPIGFWQLWHGSASVWRSFHTRTYPKHHGTAARTDVQHALQWDRRKRVHIPELVVWHLESEPAPMGANWKGRKTAPFPPDIRDNIAAVVK